jgi:hypothetical protein
VCDFFIPIIFHKMPITLKAPNVTDIAPSYPQFKVSKIKLAARRAEAQIFCPLALYRKVSGVAGLHGMTQTDEADKQKQQQRCRAFCPAAASEGRGGGLGGRRAHQNKGRKSKETMKKKLHTA